MKALNKDPNRAHSCPHGVRSQPSRGDSHKQDMKSSEVHVWGKRPEWRILEALERVVTASSCRREAWTKPAEVTRGYSGAVGVGEE